MSTGIVDEIDMEYAVILQKIPNLAKKLPTR